MRFKVERLLPYAGVAKNWLTNLSVASFAVGLYEESKLGIVCGSLLLMVACFIVYCENKKEG